MNQAHPAAAPQGSEGAREPLGRLDSLPQILLGHYPTPLEPMPHLSRHMSERLGKEVSLFVKRDDCTGLAFGGNKSRHLEFYLGEAIARGADTILITGNVQSNYVRMAAAAARKAGLACEVQLEERVPDRGPIYYRSGNVLLDRLFGAVIHRYPVGEDETGADARLEAIAERLAARGRKPYIIPLGPSHPPLGALGYVAAARELRAQCDAEGLAFDAIAIASGSGPTHSGLLFGLRALGDPTPVTGICVRRPAEPQAPRIAAQCAAIAEMLGVPDPVGPDDIRLDDGVLAPGYGQPNSAVLEAIALAAHKEGLLLDPVYTGRTMAGLLRLAEGAAAGARLLMVHTGGTPALFGYEAELAPLLSDWPGEAARWREETQNG